jgi:AcrR family transcriptional regulator
MALARAEVAGTVAPEQAYQQLHPRRNGPGRVEVSRHQRARLYAAMIEIVAERGYAATAVSELHKRARVSKRTIYDQFKSKEALFLATYEVIVARTLECVTGTYDWTQSLDCGLQAFLREVASQPQAAHLALLEALGAGPRALTVTEHTDRGCETLLAASFQRTTDGLTMPGFIPRGIVGGLSHVVRLRLLDESIEGLPGVGEELLAWMLSYRLPSGQESILAQTVAERLEPSADTAARSLSTGSGDERTVILRTATQLVARHGYASLTAAAIIQEAHISDQTFFDLFENSELCFVEALRAGTDEAFAHLTNVIDHHGYPKDIHRLIGALLGYLAANPDFARIVFVDGFALGQEGVTLTTRLLERIGELLEDPGPWAHQSSRLVGQAIAGALWAVIRPYVVGGLTDRLPEIAGQATYLALVPLIGSHPAIQVIGAGHAPTVDARLCSPGTPQRQRLASR